MLHELVSKANNMRIVSVMKMMAGGRCQTSTECMLNEDPRVGKSLTMINGYLGCALNCSSEYKGGKLYA